MEKSEAVGKRERGLEKQGKSKKKQQEVKVVYITNPIKVTASTSEFRALVQELTGQDAHVSTYAAAGPTTVATAAEENISNSQAYDDDSLWTLIRSTYD